MRQEVNILYVSTDRIKHSRNLCMMWLAICEFRECGLKVNIHTLFIDTENESESVEKLRAKLKTTQILYMFYPHECAHDIELIVDQVIGNPFSNRYMAVFFLHGDEFGLLKVCEEIRKTGRYVFYGK